MLNVFLLVAFSVALLALLYYSVRKIASLIAAKKSKPQNDKENNKKGGSN